MFIKVVTLTSFVVLGSLIPAQAETELEEFRRIAGEIGALVLRMNHNLVPNSELPVGGPRWKSTGTDKELCEDVRRAEAIIRRKKVLLQKKVLAHEEMWVAALAGAQVELEQGTLAIFRGLLPERFTRCGEPA